MTTLKIPESGVLLNSPGSNDSSVPTQTFSLFLGDSIVEGLVNYAKSGGKIQLALGPNPTLNYGPNSHHIEPPLDSFPQDIYLTQPFESTRRALQLPNVGSLFDKPKRPRTIAAGKIETAKQKGSVSSQSSSKSLDSDVEALQNGFAAHEAARERAHVVEGLPPSKKAAAKAKGKLLSGHLPPRGRSLSASPALNPVTSPPTTPFLSATQQAMERAKQQRVTLVHELAVKDQPKNRLEKKWQGTDDDLDRTLSKVAEYNEESKTWSMRKAHWRELDVWNYDYDTQAERQKAIDNAIRQYDKQRLSSSEPEWQKLLPPGERGQGKCLSRLQANLAKGPAQPTPKITVQNVDESSTSKDGGDSAESEKGGSHGEAMARTESNGSISKPKKALNTQAQTKRLLGKSKPAKAPIQKPSPTKGKIAGTKASAVRVLSQAIIENSDSSGDEALAFKSKPEARRNIDDNDKVKDTVVVHSQASPKLPSRPQPQIGKRRRDDDIEDSSSSSSGTPLARRLTQKPVRVLKPPNHRASDAPQISRAAVPAPSNKNKTTSPTKSSPLASSPPTNASDVEDDTLLVSKKRKLDKEDFPAIKRQGMRSVSTDVIKQAQRFKSFYRKYESLHWEIAGLDNPPDSKLADLLDMRHRLAGMKKDIYRQHASDRD